MNNIKTALLSVSDKTPTFFQLAEKLNRYNYNILASGGTYSKLQEKGLPVTDVAKITGLPPVLGHRVVTLAPQVHGGLLTDPDNPAMVAELDSLGWPLIDLLVCTFYPLEETIAKNPSDTKGIIEKIDIGGPAMVRSACKGKKLVLTSEDQFEEFMQRLEDHMVNNIYRLALQYKAALHVQEYVAAEARFRFGLLK